MIEWFTAVQIGVAIVAGVVCIGFGLATRAPNDFTLGALALVELLLIAQIVVTVVAPLVGSAPTGSAVEFWIYLVSASALPPAAGFFALVDRSKWSTVVLGVAALAVAVMLYRMGQIWFVQIA